MIRSSLSAPQDRRAFLRSAALLVGAAALVPAVARGADVAPGTPITIYKDPDCGCCKLWVDHVTKAGFTATVHDTRDMDSVKASMGVPAALHSCHTARVGNYTIEGHVPADVIRQLLKEKPAGRGLAVPGMPAGSPGMEMGGRKDAYDIKLFDKSGKSRTYASR